MEPRAQAFAGRAGELGTLEQALAAARAGRGAAILVTGDAGIGKTRLAAELIRRARDGGFATLLGRSIDLVGTELPYQPFAEALRPLGGPRPADAPAGSQLRVFEETLARLADHAAGAPVLLVLEDLHWADTSTLDLVVFLAHHLAERPVVLLVTYRQDEPSSKGRMARLADGVRRSGSGLVLDLGPLPPGDLAALLASASAAAVPPALADAIVARSGGNPFFAEELLAVGDTVELPRRLRDLLLQRVARLDPATQGLLRLAAAAGRDVGYPLLRALAAVAEPDVRDSLRQAVEHGVLVADQVSGTFRFRHPLLAEAVYSTILPGEREELHARLAGELSRTAAASPAELAPHWAAAGRAAQALTASVAAARQAEAVFGLPEALAHLERALGLWPAVPDAAQLAGLDLARLCAWTAELASYTGADRRAAELARRAIGLVGADDPHRSALLHVRLGEYLYGTGEDEAALAALERAVELAPTQPASAERAYALASLAGGLMVAWRHAESVPICEQALALARDIGAREAEVRALTALGVDLAHLGRDEDGVACIREAARLAEEIGDHLGLELAYVNLTDVLTMLGRPRESARLGQQAYEVIRGYGMGSTLLVTNRIEALLAIGDWDKADELSTAALGGIASSFSYWLLTIRADLDIGRGDFTAARAHLDAAGATLPRDHDQGRYDTRLAELALWERRWTDADAAIHNGLGRARQPELAQIRVQLCATGLRAQAELAALARARRDDAALRAHLDRACDLLALARRAADAAAPITPNATAWHLQAHAEHIRTATATAAGPQAWADAAAAWDRLERPPLAAYCRWRQAETLVAAGASRAEASVPLRDAHAVADRIGARPLATELELLAQRARLDLTPSVAGSPSGKRVLEEALGLTPREADVLALIARGYTNREIASTLVISVKTAGVHVSHILRKLDAPNRQQAAAIAHRLTPGPGS